MKLPLEDLLPDQAIITNLRANTPTRRDRGARGARVHERLARRQAVVRRRGRRARERWRRRRWRAASRSSTRARRTRARSRRPFIIVGRSLERHPVRRARRQSDVSVLPARPQVRPAAPADPRPARARAAQPGDDRQAALAQLARPGPRAAPQGGRGRARRRRTGIPGGGVQAQARPDPAPARDPPPAGGQEAANRRAQAPASGASPSGRREPGRS